MRKQYEMLSARDRLALKVLLVALSLVILIFGLMKPAYEYKKQAEAKLEQNQQLLALVNQNKAALRSLGQNNQGSASKKALNSQQLVSSVTNLAKQQKVALKRFEPSGDNKLKVWVDDASFDKVISWLSRLKSSLGVRVEQISIDKDDAPGKISARMTLSS
ncbi:hypothetical protein A3755_09950 [Oleiphilus sp. HI0085]|nr:hypothetical protein A3755_09950 [Oleiphilus sp. HI0085]